MWRLFKLTRSTVRNYLRQLGAPENEKLVQKCIPCVHGLAYATYDRPQPKGKQGTKGQKQIYDENQQTLRFYLYIIAGANVLYFTVFGLLFRDSLALLHYVMMGLCVMLYLGSYQFMSYMARATFGAAGNLVDSGTDLNMGDGLSEHMKDLILMTAIVQTLSLLSDYFWLLMLLVPGRAFYMLWVNFLGPWFFAEPEPEMDDKKAKKMERKMKQRQIIRR